MVLRHDASLTPQGSAGCNHSSTKNVDLALNNSVSRATVVNLNYQLS